MVNLWGHLQLMNKKVYFSWPSLLLHKKTQNLQCPVEVNRYWCLCVVPSTWSRNTKDLILFF